MSEDNIKSINIEEKIVAKKSKKNIPEVISVQNIDATTTPIPVENSEKEASITMFGLIKNTMPSQRCQKIDRVLTGKTFLFKK